MFFLLSSGPEKEWGFMLCPPYWSGGSSALRQEQAPGPLPTGTTAPSPTHTTLMSQHCEKQTNLVGEKQRALSRVFRVFQDGPDQLKHRGDSCTKTPMMRCGGHIRLPAP